MSFLAGVYDKQHILRLRQQLRLHYRFLAFDVPDYVRVPQELDHESAGKRLRVVNTREVRCICGGHNALAWELQGGELSIIRCHIQQAFFTVRINQNGED